MTKDQHYKAFFEAIYNATRAGATITFSPDVHPSSMTITLDKVDGTSTHTHCGSQYNAPSLTVKAITRFINTESCDKTTNPAHTERG